ncbi:hypothetical protein Gohar_006033 [Gossypium harknessii]|uniref:Uncharacterized protein n=1 Tax=Gossypium harknessii TaxID=34285 RepID=A0A7J9GC30_9ROSI|nr:hypothetical protein [Gossypium harknessii]
MERIFCCQRNHGYSCYLWNFTGRLVSSVESVNGSLLSCRKRS